MYIEVHIFDLPYHLDRPFDYLGVEGVEVGSVVRVPFGRSNRLRYAVVTKIKDMTDGKPDEVKSVHSLVNELFRLTPEMMALALFMKEHTLSTLGESVRAILPPGALSDSLNIKMRRTVSLSRPREEILALLQAEGRAGIRSEGQRQILNYLIDIGSSDVELVRRQPGVSSANIKALVDKGILTVTEDEEIRNPYARYQEVTDHSEIMLSRAQSTAYDTIESKLLEDSPEAVLLFGVTGSGKTKVIMKAIDRTLSMGRTVIMLVPEISLTPQTVSIFCSRYGSRVAVIHSSLSQGERLDAYRRIRRGDVDLVIGTRSAIFAPLSNIGMIVIDEEHEHTYKSETDPKYHARDIAAFRAMKNNSLMLLASATPSLESYYKAKCGVYTLVPLRERYGGVRLPEAVIVDMREELRLGNTSPISKRLYDELIKVGEREDQAILFLNRRGYSSQISCKECGEVMVCPRCSVSLTYHQYADGARLLCHMCGYSTPMPRACPCGSERLSRLGFGTQKLESELSALLPDMPLMRMDADTTSGKLAYDKMLEDFRAGTADILVGTQMVAKGHDFPRVSLVGVALADTSLYVSDFRANERTFQLLTQVIGRAGRAKDGGVAVIQTFLPRNETILLACEQDYESFYEGEIAIRRELKYPPFCDMVALTVTSEDEAKLFLAAKKLSDSIISKLSGEYSNQPFAVFGPFEAQVYKLNEKYRMRMVVKCKLNSTSRKLFKELLIEFSSEREVTLSIDTNPLTV